MTPDDTELVRRGGRARLKASDSKSDRGVSPSGVQILSPPPNSLQGGTGVHGRGDRVAEGAALEMPCTGNCTVGSNPTPSANSTVGPDCRTFGSAGEEGPRCEAAPEGRTRGVLAVRRACGRGGQRSRWALIGSRRRLAVLDGEVAVPCNPQSAIAGLNSLSRAAGVE